MVDLYEDWTTNFPIITIEDGLDEEDWDGWELLTTRLGLHTQLVGDDLFVTNVKRLSEGIEKGIANALQRLGITVITMNRKFESVDYDKGYLEALADLIQKNPDASCVFSVNFQPIVARCCKVFKLPYLSWTVDCPSFQLYSETIAYPTNRIFVLDRMQWEKFSPANPDCIFHLPMGADVATWDEIKVTAEDHQNYDCDVSFVGSLYSEKTRYNSIEKDLPDAMRGYVDGLIAAQLNVYGYNLLEDSITDEWAQEFKKYADWAPLGED